MTGEQPSNRLSECSSPYLLQHASNPVAWQPWDEAAIESARQLDRPLLVSIGYAACHWCHVMEHESFDDAQVAALMNEKLVCIKVDREERPDVDALYMAACQAMTGSGGWPLNAFLDPHTLRPFFAGTYFPPEPRFGRPSWQQLIEMLCEAWDGKRQDILDNAERVIQHLRSQDGQVESEDDPRAIVAASLMASGLHSLKLHDSVDGGFGGAPKFPHPMELEGLIRNGSTDALAAVEHSLNCMASRGLFDHLGGGWHRYCVDAAWAVPHFEKMLYDNALLLSVHGLALRMGVGEADMHERVIDLTLGWLQREMLDPDGGCWSTLDADSEDSSGRKEEGEFYLWTPAEVEAVLGPELASSACQYWSVTDEGNFEGSGRSVLALGEVSGEMDEESLRSKLLAARAERPRPGTDDKVLTAWNGMLLLACSELLGEAAESVGQHLAMGLLQRSSAEDGSVLRTWRGEVNGGAGFLDDHAWAALGLLQWGVRHDLAEPVERALAITARMLDSFADVEGGFWLTTAEHGELPIRQRSESDSAIPGATAVAVKLLASLEAILPEHADAALWRSSAEAAIKRLSSSLKHRGPAYWSLLNAAQDLHNPWAIWHIHHDGNEPPEAEALRASAPPRSLVISSTNAEAGRDRGDAPWRAWLCEGLACQPPIDDAAELRW